MMDIGTIREMSRNAAIDAAVRHRKPLIVEAEDIEALKAGKHLPIPFLGDYVPKGWKRTDREVMFVDSSGFGATGEPAMTLNSFFDSLIPGKGYATVEQGQFQVYVAEYEKVKAA
jgi:hypothetical protein